MNAPVAQKHHQKPAKPEIVASACPHDCPSTCALEVERLDAHTIGRIRGAEGNDYTNGVICAKVARYAERVHHPERLTTPLLRTGPKGSRQFKPIAWGEALDRVAEAFLKAEALHGSETVWPYYYAGTMGLVQRDGINRLRHVKKYSGFFSSICVNLARYTYIAGTGKLMGSDPREMAVSDCVVIWGTNAVATQVNVMTLAVKARKERGAKIVVIDPYRNATAEQADMHLMLRPGTDGALACAVMHIFFRDKLADWDYLEKYTDHPHAFAEHLESRGPSWAAAITGLKESEIEAFAALLAERRRHYLRLGYGFTRSRNGAVNMHAALSIAAVTGAWKYEGGGAFHNSGGIYHWDRTLIEGNDCIDRSIRQLDQSRIGPVLTNDPRDLGRGPPVTAMLIQSTNPMVVAPEQALVRQGFAREDLFTCVHEQFMTETAAMADVVLPATTFLEHDDIYQGGGHQYIQFGPKVIEPPGEARENHFVICELARRLGAEHRGFGLSAFEMADETLRASGYPGAAELKARRWFNCQPSFEEAHFLGGFAHADGKYRFALDWPALQKIYVANPVPDIAVMPRFPDHCDIIDAATPERPFRLMTSPSRSFLNTTFSETPGSRKREGRPELLIHPDDAGQAGLVDGSRCRIGNRRGDLVLHVRHFDGVQRGVVVSEGLWPNHAFEEGNGINLLTGADAAAPSGGAAFHDTSIWIRPA